MNQIFCKEQKCVIRERENMKKVVVGLAAVAAAVAAVVYRLSLS